MDEYLDPNPFVEMLISGPSTGSNANYIHGRRLGPTMTF